MNSLRIGVIGLGWFGEIHCETILGVPNLELTALCTRRPERLKSQAEKFGVKKTYRVTAICSPIRISMLSQSSPCGTNTQTWRLRRWRRASMCSWKSLWHPQFLTAPRSSRHRRKPRAFCRSGISADSIRAIEWQNKPLTQAKSARIILKAFFRKNNPKNISSNTFFSY